MKNQEYVEIKMFEPEGDGITWMTSSKSLEKHGVNKILAFRTKSFLQDRDKTSKNPEAEGHRVEIF